MDKSTHLLYETLDDLIRASAICKLYVWDEEPSKYSHALIHRRSEHFCLASIFDVDGSYEGIRCVRLEDIHRLAFDDERCRFVASLPFLERELAMTMFRPFISCDDFESFLLAIQSIGLPCELMDNDMESTMGKVEAADEWSVLIEKFDEDSRTFGGKMLFDLEGIRYPWACTKRTRLVVGP